MAVIHTKTKYGLVAAIIILIILATLPFIDTIGFGGFIVVVFIAAIIFIPIVIALNGGGSITAHQRYEKAIKNSSGIEKLRLKVRSDSITFCNRFKKDGDDYSISSTGTEVARIYIHLADSFYGMLKEYYKSTQNDLFDKLSDIITSDKEKELIISSKIFGISLGIVTQKAAEETNQDILKAKVTRLVNHCQFNEMCKKEILNMLESYFKLIHSKSIAGDVERRWALLEKMTYSLVGATITRKKGDIANPMLIKPLDAAISNVYNEISLSVKTIEELEKEGLIASNKKYIKKVK